MGVPSAARTPPCVLRMRNSGSRSRAGSQPMPASCEKPKRLPEGCVSSISGVMGSMPSGPLACVRTSAKSDWSLSSTSRSGRGSGMRRLLQGIACGRLREPENDERRDYEEDGHQQVAGTFASGGGAQPAYEVDANERAERTCAVDQRHHFADAILRDALRHDGEERTIGRIHCAARDQQAEI